MAKKERVIWEGTTRERDAIFSQGLIVSDYNQLFFLTGQVDQDAEGNIRHPGDPVGQARGVLGSLTGMLEQEGWSLHDVIRVDLTVTKDVMPLTEVSEAVRQVWADTFKDVNPKPAAGTTRIIHALGGLGALVEFEFLAAR